MSNDMLIKVAESIDNLMCTDMASRGIIHHLYRAARALTENPLSYTVAKACLEKVNPMDKVLIVTGWIDQPLVSPDRGESDGPAGAVALARALSVACKACPIIMVDECLVKSIKKVACASGFECVPVEHLEYAIKLNRLRTLSVIGFPRGHEAGKNFSKEALEKYEPKLCISIERGGMNEKGVIHNMLGADTGAEQAFMDYMFQDAREKGIFTVAIGDGGNELGMGNIKDIVEKKVPNGCKCQCSCGLGIAAATKVDLLLTSSISNWGAYAIAAMLAVMSGQGTALQTPAEEMRILEASAQAGFHDGMYGCLGTSVDGCPAESHVAMVTLMRQVAQI